MTSELKSATARANGAKSHDPKTAAAREISSCNSLGHGCTARNTIVLQCECPAEFQQMIAEFEAAYNPANEAQKNLVDQMVAARWRLDRLCLIETALFDTEMDHVHSLPNNSPDTGIRLARAFRSLADNTNALTLVRRYQSTLHRIYDQAYRTLRELKAAEPDTARPAVQTSAAQPEPAQPAPPQKAVEHATAKPEATPTSRLQNEPTTRARAVLRWRWLSLRLENARRRRAASGGKE